MNFPVLYASGRDGWAVRELEDEPQDLIPLLGSIQELAPAPNVELEAPFQMQVATIGYDDFIGRIAIGRILKGKIKREVNSLASDSVKMDREKRELPV